MAEPTSPGDLCVNCGLCCTDAMFTHIEIDETDRHSLLDTAYPRELIGEDRIPLPCPMLEGTACTIYGQRPSGCRKYRCEVLKAAEAGTMGVAEAWVHVGKARELLAGLRAHLPAGASVYDAHKRWNAKLGGGTTVEPSETAARLAYVAYCFYMDRYFRSRTTALLLRMSR